MSDVHDAGHGVDVHHGLDGSSHSTRSLPGGGRVFASRGGGGYVQHSYAFHGREFGHRTFFEHGRVFDRFYGPYRYRGLFFDVFVASAFYPVGLYAYGYSPWVTPVVYAGPPFVVAPVFSYYYAPYRVYPAPAFFLADAVIATSLVAAYDAQQAAPQAQVASLAPIPDGMDAGQQLMNALIPAAYAQQGATTLTKPMKDQLAAEIQEILKQDEKDAKINAAGQDVDPAGGNIVKLFSDGKPHVLLAGASVDVVASSGKECVITAGDLLSVDHVGGDSAEARVVASKHGAKECPMGSTLSVAVRDLQDMYNFMRESVDDHLKDLQKKGGTGGLPPTPASAQGPVTKASFANGAPPPDTDAAQQIAALNAQSAASEKEVTSSVAADGGGQGH